MRKASPFTVRKYSIYVITITVYWVLFIILGIIINSGYSKLLLTYDIVNILIITFSYIAIAIDIYYYEKRKKYILIAVKIVLFLIAIALTLEFFVMNNNYKKMECWSRLYFDLLYLIVMIPFLLQVKKLKKLELERTVYRVENRLFDSDREYYIETPYEYEQRVAEYLRSIGYLQVDTTPKSGDYGADVIAVSPNGIRMCVQCKQYSEENKVGVKAVQEIYAAKDYYDCKLAYIFTTSGYTDQARRMADRLGVVLLEYK